MSKSNTDLHWNERALTERDNARVNIGDTVQRDLELAFILEQLPPAGRVLEVGCGNGYVTQQLRNNSRHVDAFDYAENMIERARSTYGEKNGRFFHGSVLDRKACEPRSYDAVVCVRVLINLRDFNQQVSAIDNIACWIKSGGKLILVEGYQEGFESLNALRAACGMPPLRTASINFYSRFEKLKAAALGDSFEIEAEFHTGMFDFLTRVVFPALVGPEQAAGPADFHEKIKAIPLNYNPDAMKDLARVRGLALKRRV